MWRLYLGLALEMPVFRRRRVRRLRLLTVLALVFACETPGEVQPSDAPLLSDYAMNDMSSDVRSMARVVPVSHIERGPMLHTSGNGTAGHNFECLVITWGADPNGVTITFAARP